jgi:RES domain-containing protein
MPHADLVGAIAKVTAVSWDGSAYRHVALGRSPLSGEGARLMGGRWNPRGSFAVLYLGLSEESVLAEFERFAARQGLTAESFLPRAFYTYEVSLSQVLDLRQPEVRQHVGLDDSDLTDDDLTACQAVGDAAHASGLEGILVPGATERGDVLAVFIGGLLAGSDVRDVESQVWESLPDAS